MMVYLKTFVPMVSSSTHDPSLGDIHGQLRDLLLLFHFYGRSAGLKCDIFTDTKGFISDSSFSFSNTVKAHPADVEEAWWWWRRGRRKGFTRARLFHSLLYSVNVHAFWSLFDAGGWWWAHVICASWLGITCIYCTTSVPVAMYCLHLAQVQWRLGRSRPPSTWSDAFDSVPEDTCRHRTHRPQAHTDAYWLGCALWTNCEVLWVAGQWFCDGCTSPEDHAPKASVAQQGQSRRSSAEPPNHKDRQYSTKSFVSRLLACYFKWLTGSCCHM